MRQESLVLLYRAEFYSELFFKILFYRFPAGVWASLFLEKNDFSFHARKGALKIMILSFIIH